MATDSLTWLQSRSQTQNNYKELEDQIEFLKKLLPNMRYDVDVKSDDDMFEVLLSTIEYINLLRDALKY